MKTILVTGGAGFIGSNFIPYFMGKHPDYKIVNLDLLTYAGNSKNLTKIESLPNYHFIKGDIGDKNLVERLFSEFEITGVIHFAAESHVDNAIMNPDIFIRTNIIGTFTLLEVARKHWAGNYDHCRFHQISTDEVYGSLGKSGSFTEMSAYAPNSPYSASKASGDLLVRSYAQTYGLNTVTSLCANNYGPKQHAEKLIPTIIRTALAGAPIPIYGNGKNIRDWIFVLDHCKALDLIFHQGRAGQAYNVGANAEKDNLAISRSICELLDILRPRADKKSYLAQITFVKDRPGHDLRYAINASKLKKELGWRADEKFESGLVHTIKWYLGKYEDKL
jgi:dTDP-glucose 4,6-dehydratase